ncbi:MAG: hypothetical protein ACUVQP_11620, partial [Bacteroidales bacterium]
MMRLTILSFIALALTGCTVLGSDGIPAPGKATAFVEPSPSPTAISVSQQIREQAPIVAPSNPVYESAFFPDLNYGEVNGLPYGAISADDVAKNNPGYILPDEQPESRFNYLYKKDEPDVLRGLGLDQNYLMDLFNATRLDNGELVGQLPDGTEVHFSGGFWQYNKDGQTYYLLSNIADIEGRTLGFPLLVVDQATQKKLSFGIVDENGKLLDGERFNPAFMSTEELAKNLGYTGDTSLIGSFMYGVRGDIIALGHDGKTVVFRIPYLDPSAEDLNSTTVLPEYRDLKAILDEKKISYHISLDGKITVKDYSQPDSDEDFIFKPDSVKIVKTKSALHPEIVTAIDTNGDKFAFNPDYGWFKIPEVYNPVIDWVTLSDENLLKQRELLDPEKYTEVDEDYFRDGRFDIVQTLRYLDNPTINPNHSRVQWWVNYQWYMKVFGIALHPNAGNAYAYLKYPDKMSPDIYYGNEDRPFDFTGYYKVRMKDGKTVYVVAETSINPTEDDPDQIINLAYGFDEETYIKMASEMVGLADSRLQFFLGSVADGSKNILIVLIPEGEIRLDPNNTIYGDPNPYVASLQKPGEIISLFPKEEQELIYQVLKEGFENSHHISAPLRRLPEKLSKLTMSSYLAKMARIWH